MIKNQALIYTLVAVLFSVNLYSQSDKQEKTVKQVNFSAGIYNNDIFRFEDIEGAGHYSNGPAVQYGMNFSLPLDHKLWMGFGVYYLKAINTFHSPPTAEDAGYSLKHKSEIVHLPVEWKYNFTDWFALKVGLSIGIEFKNDNNLNQNGLGFLGGAIIHYSPLPWLDAGIEPTFHLTSMLPIPQEFNQQHFLLSGANTYVALRF